MVNIIRVVDKKSSDLNESVHKTKKIKEELSKLEDEVNFTKFSQEIKNQVSHEAHKLDHKFSVENASEYLRTYKNLNEKQHRTTYLAALQIILRWFKCYDGPINGKKTSTLKSALKAFENKYHVHCGKLMDTSTRTIILQQLRLDKKQREEKYEFEQSKKKQSQESSHQPQNSSTTGKKNTNNNNHKPSHTTPPHKDTPHDNPTNDSKTDSKTESQPQNQTDDTNKNKLEEQSDTQKTKEMFNQQSISLDDSFFKSPLFMSWTNRALSHFFGFTQYTKILQEYNHIDNNLSNMNITSLKDQTLEIPYIYPDLQDKFPLTLSEYQAQSPYKEHSKLKNTTNDLVVIKKVEGKFALCYYQNGAMKLATYVSPWKEDLWKTPTGVFSLDYKIQEKTSQLYDDAAMPYSIHVHGAGKGWIFLHQGYSDGNPQSHGCIRVPWIYQKYLFENIQNNSHIPIVIEDENKTTSTPPTQDENIPQRNTSILERNIRGDNLIINGKSYKIQVNTDNDSSPFFALSYNWYWVPDLRYPGYNPNYLSHQEAYEYFVLLAKSGEDILSTWRSWRRNPGGKTWNQYRTDYFNTLIQQGKKHPSQQQEELKIQAKSNIRNHSYSQLDVQDIAKIKNLIERQRLNVGTDGNPHPQNLWIPRIIQYKNQIFVGAPSYTSPNYYTFLWPNRQYFSFTKR